MRNLFVNKLKYTIKCADNSTYGALVEFKKGLNVIYGPNSVGKSSIITGILYGLGAEKGLGIFKLKDNPFKPEFYEKIEKKNIIESYILLEISNSHETITIKRNIIGKTNICIVKKCELEQFYTINDSKSYIIGNGTMDEHGFQKFLFNFLNWEIVEVVGYDGENTKLYFENLVPLFFVEQKAGWSQIQARQITRYNIRDVKKISFEYLLGLGKFNVHLLELEKKEISNKIKSLKTELDLKRDYILTLGNATVSDNNVLIIDRIGFGRYEINDLICHIENLLKEKEEKIQAIYDKKDLFDSSANSKRDKLRQILNLKTLALEKKRDLVREINSYKNYIAKIEINKKKNKQLEQIQKLNLELNITRCPVCESKLGSNDESHCRLCKSEISSISTATENLLFLEDEKSSFVKILGARELELEKTLQIIQNLSSDETYLKNMLDFQMKTYLGQEIQNLRELATEIDKLYSDILSYKGLLSKWEDLEPLMHKIDEAEKRKKQIENEIKDYNKSTTDQDILNTIKNFLISNSKELHLFTSSKLTNDIKLEMSDNYTPSLEFYDISNISSSSDYIRIILSYYLALLQTSVKLFNVERIKYPNLLILDEPKQQNLDDSAIKAFVKIIEEIPNSDNWQIILTTFNPEKSLLEKYIRYEMKHRYDFLLKKVNS